MKCLCCGYCCIMHDVIVPLRYIPKYSKSMKDEIEYARYKPSGEFCWNLVYDIKDKKANCLIHDKKFYKDCPCDRHGQIERSKDDLCRMGEYITKGNLLDKLIKVKYKE